MAEQNTQTETNTTTETKIVETNLDYKDMYEKLLSNTNLHEQTTKNLFEQINNLKTEKDTTIKQHAVSIEENTKLKETIIDLEINKNFLKNNVNPEYTNFIKSEILKSIDSMNYENKLQNLDTVMDNYLKHNPKYIALEKVNPTDIMSNAQSDFLTKEQINNLNPLQKIGYLIKLGKKSK